MTDWTDERMVELRNVLYAYPEHTDVHRVLRALVAERDALREALREIAGENRPVDWCPK